MLKSELLRRIIPSGTGLDVQALAALDVVGQASADGLISIDGASITGADLNVGENVHVSKSAIVALRLANGFQWFELDDGEIDFTVVANHTITLPAGFYLVATQVRLFYTQLDGTLTSAPTANMGNNAAKTNIIASSNTALGAVATFNASAAPALSTPAAGLTNLNPASNNNTLVSTTTPFTLQITVGAVLNTATKCKGRVQLAGWLSPI